MLSSISGKTKTMAKGPQFSAARLEPAFDYIEGYWRRLEKFNPHDDGTLVGVPRPYFVPSVAKDTGFAFEEIYYWDTYFIAQGFLGTAREHLLKGLVEDLLALMNRFGVIPNAGRTYFTSRSQPPLLTSFIFEVYRLENNKGWLDRAMDVAKEEYRTVWMGMSQPNWRQVFHGLSRYYDINVLDDLAEAESGWDMTTRFNRQCLSYIPVDLNALLYKYERDFAESAKILGNDEESGEWTKRALKRKAMMHKYLWDADKGFYFDYNYMTGERSRVWSLAGFYPMWAGMDDVRTATQVMKHLDKFEFAGGLATTAVKPHVEFSLPTQWAYPNGWAPLQLITCEAMNRYGFNGAAERVARKWLEANLVQFEARGEFFEKYNVVSIKDEPVAGVYPSQSGFGWTNAVFVRLAQQYLTPQELPKLAAASHHTFLQSLSLLPGQPMRGLSAKLARKHA
jgi:alpha,alpha-trehalase